MFNTTVVLTHDVNPDTNVLLFQGGGATVSQFMTPLQALIMGSPQLKGPCFLLDQTQRVR